MFTIQKIDESNLSLDDFFNLEILKNKVQMFSRRIGNLKLKIYLHVLLTREASNCDIYYKNIFFRKYSFCI